MYLLIMLKYLKPCISALSHKRKIEGCIIMKYSEFSSEIQIMLKSNGVIWDDKKKVYLTTLHKNLYLNDDEMKSENEAREFVKLLEYLNNHQEFGVNTQWASSVLNRSIYLHKKDELKKTFPLTMDSLSRFYDDSDIVNFYKSQGALSPTVIDLVGTTGAGKTTFCQQFVDEGSKDLLKLTITDVGESTVIQTDILILEKTDKKMFLKVRNKIDIMRDILLVALEIDLTKDSANIAGKIKKSSELRDKDIIDKVSNFYYSAHLFAKFIDFTVKVQSDYGSSSEKAKWVQLNLSNVDYQYIIDEIVEAEYETDYFYGYRMEYNLDNDGETQIITTIANTAFKNRKEEIEEYPEMSNEVSKWLLYEHAILVLPCSDKAKEKVNYNFQEGLVFRDSRGHNLDEQSGIAADFEVKNKIFLIPIDTSGYLIDERYSHLFEKILISEPKNNIFVLTKIDYNKTYKKYKDSGYENFKGFIKEFSEKLAKTHDNILKRFIEKQNTIDKTTEFYKDETNLFENFMTSFDNAYFSEIEDDTYESEGHKITYDGNALDEFDKSKVKIEYLDSWFEIIDGIIGKNKFTYHENINRISKVNPSNQELIVKESTKYVKSLVSYFSSIQKWEDEVEYQLKIFKEDYRSYYPTSKVWYYSTYIADGNSTTNGARFKDFTSELIRDVKSYIVKGKSSNYFMEMLVKPLNTYLSTIYKNKNQNIDIIKTMSESIISNALEKAVKISYKAFERGLISNYKLDNIKMIYDDKTGNYVKPTSITYKEIEKESRDYYTYTEEYFCIYCNLLSKYKYNIDKYLVDIFATIVENELEEVDKKIK